MTWMTLVFLLFFILCNGCNPPTRLTVQLWFVVGESAFLDACSYRPCGNKSELKQLIDAALVLFAIENQRTA